MHLSEHADPELFPLELSLNAASHAVEPLEVDVVGFLRLIYRLKMLFIIALPLHGVVLLVRLAADELMDRGSSNRRLLPSISSRHLTERDAFLSAIVRDTRGKSTIHLR